MPRLLEESPVGPDGRQQAHVRHDADAFGDRAQPGIDASTQSGGEIKIDHAVGETQAAHLQPVQYAARKRQHINQAAQEKALFARRQCGIVGHGQRPGYETGDTDQRTHDKATPMHLDLLV